MTATTDPTTYGRVWADRYDEWFNRDDPASIVAFFDRFATDRSLLELGVGTGRVALPLAEAGYRVHGIDASAQMLTALKAKPGGELVTCSEDDMSDFTLDAKFGIATCLYSSFFLLPDQEAQLRCLAAAARHVMPGGVVIIEGFIFNPQRWNGGRSVDVPAWGPDAATVNTGVLFRAEQAIETLRMDVVGDKVEIRRNRLRWVLPAELDLMARLCGMHLVARFEDLAGSPYTNASDNQVSVYRVP